MIAPAPNVEEIEIWPQKGAQERFLDCGADICFYVGSAGAGKSFALAMEGQRYSEAEGYAGIILRRTFTQLQGGGSIIEETKGLYPSQGGTLVESPHPKWTFKPSGATLEFGHCQHEKDVHSYQSKQFAFIGFDEITQFSESQFFYLLSRLRSVCGVKPYVRAATNPDPDSFVRKMIDWYIAEDGFPIPERDGVIRWMVRDGDDLVWGDSEAELQEKIPGCLPMSFTIIIANLSDNPALLRKDPTYVARLSMLPRVERERLLGGNWNVRATGGSYFSRSYFEIVDDPPIESQIVSIARGWDFAATKPSTTSPDPDWTAGVLYCRTRNGDLYILHCERFRDGPAEVDRRFINLAQADGPRVKQAIPQDPGAAGKSEADRRKRILTAKGYRCHVERISGSKESYAAGPSSAAEGGLVKIVRGAWNDALLNEAESFPLKGVHDDQIDAWSLAHRVVCNDKSDFLRRMTGQ